jgi:cyclic pyranopterin phosphate synthase
MVDVGHKPVTARTARAMALVQADPATILRIRQAGFEKGNVVEVARLAAIMAAKKTSDLIPLCHPLPLDSVTVDFSFPDDCRVRIEVEVRVTARTGAEMEALTAASVGALTVYDMCKSADRSMSVQEVCLLEKSGGKSGAFRRQA